MRLIRLAMALMAMSFSWAALANPAVNNGVGSVSGTVSTTAATQIVAGGAAQVRLDGAALTGATLTGDARASHRNSSTTGGMNESSVPSYGLMALVTVLLIGHQLRRKHRFLRPQQFSNL